MYKVLKADRDAYITNRVIRNTRKTTANTGIAGSLNLFKLYGVTSSGSVPNTELSRLLLHYDLDPIRTLVSSGHIDTSNASFHCELKLFDVYGGQPTPARFSVVLNPLSRSFEEGDGLDVVYYGDSDVCNFLSGSRAQGAWLMSGCNLSGGIPGSVDYITASTSINAGVSLTGTQFFTTGEEDLSIDVTRIVSATLASTLPDEGFRLSFAETHENDTKTYFVKRFGARTAYDPTKRPALIVKFDDSIQDDSLGLFFDTQSTLFLYNRKQSLVNIRSGSSQTQITGSNSLVLKLETEVSGGWYTLQFSGSQHQRGINAVTGVYSSSVIIDSSVPLIANKLAQSGSIKFRQIWGSLDGTVAYSSGSSVTFFPQRNDSIGIESMKFVISTQGIKQTFSTLEGPVMVRVNLFGANDPSVIASRLPVENHGTSLRDVHFQVRDLTNNFIAVPFDVLKNATRMSSDSRGMFFKLDISNLMPGRSYIVDVLLYVNGERATFMSATPSFQIEL